MTKLQRILIGLLIVQVILAGVVLWPRGVAAVAKEPLFPGLNADNVVRLTIAGNEGSSVELARQGDAWVLANGGDYPAIGESITAVIAKIAAAQTDRLVAQTAVSQKQLQVADDDFVRHVTLETSDGETFEFYMGSAPSTSTTHVRRAGEEATYLVANLNVWEISQLASSWVDTAYVELDEATVTAVTLQNANGTFTFHKTGPDEWVMDDLAADETFNRGNFNLILNRGASLRLTRPLGKEAQPAYGMDTPQASLTLTVESDNASGVYTLDVGTALENGNAVVKWSGSPYYAEVSPFTVENLLNFGRSDFLEVPTPEAETGG
ncbi:MAG: DUF4340 domain-containing protein [Ardenticatenaceae bacterium]|nr:DUF4340 domain-containing protein [Anaerolineales bacterium]MCB8922070.1 DUF4340 domain-containing protein [Ardenticatenaceae bacterium]MCB9003186.1 DUF4340 domain-containing protein [Ardenticatenaceae bacterium]